jgi:hypothetical protein
MDDRKQFRVYLIGYEPPELELTPDTIERLIAQADMCAVVDGVVEVGSEVQVARTVAGNPMRAPPNGARLRCVSHEHHGKVIMAEEMK